MSGTGPRGGTAGLEAFLPGRQEPAAGEQPTDGRLSRWWRSNRGLVALGVLLVLGVVVGVLGAAGPPGERLDVDSPAPDGGRAVAEVLRRQGVDVRAESALADVLDTARPGTTLLILQADLLDPDRLQELRGTGADLVLVEPTLPVLQVLAPEVSLGGTSPAYVVGPGCDDADALAAGDARGGSSRYVAATGGTPPGVSGEQRSATARVSVCYAPGEGTNPDAGSYVVVDDPALSRRVVVHGQSDVLTNEWLAQEGNASLALRSLGRHATLLWYRPDPLDLAAGDEQTVSAVDLLPRWVAWVGLQLVVVAALAVLWRFRRLGRLVPERLPAVVRSAETTEGRARLYRAAGARQTAARLLRRATVRRLATRLATGQQSDLDVVADLAARATGRDAQAVHDLLGGPPPRDDAGLVRLADDLDQIEREVARR